MRPSKATSPPQATRGGDATVSVPARSDIGENSASELVESPQKPGSNPLVAHDFADGGGGGGGAAFSRKRVKATRRAAR